MLGNQVPDAAYYKNKFLPKILAVNNVDSLDCIGNVPEKYQVFISSVPFPNFQADHLLKSD